MRYLFCFDLDGTLLKEGNTISEYTVEKIKEIKELGHIVTIVTGRALRNSIYIYEKLGLDTIIANEDGRVLQNPSDSSFKKINSLIPNAEAIKFYKKMKNSLNGILFEANEESFVDDLNNPITKLGNSKASLKDILTIKQDLNAFIFFIKNEDIKKANEELESYSNISMRLWPGSPLEGYTLAEIHSLLFDKGTAVRFIKNYYLGEYDKVICFGDSRNDISMFKEADISVALKNAPKEIRQIARYVTDFPNYEDGVVKYIDKLLKRKMFFFDLDGTLLNDESLLASETVDYINSIKDDHLIIINTGRPYLAAIDFYNRLGLNTLLATNNGRNIINPKNIQESIYNNISKNEAYKILNEVKNYISFYRFDKDCICYQPIESSFLGHTRYHKITLEGPSDDVTDIDSCFFAIKSEYVFDFFNHIKSNYPHLNVRVLFERDNHQMVEVLLKGFTKKYAVDYLMDYYHVPFDNVYTIGDNNNDLEMLRYFKSAAPKNSSIKALEYATHLIPSNNDLGPIKFVEQVLNGNIE